MSVRFAIVALLALSGLQLSGQLGTGLLAPNRQIDWSSAGATIPTGTIANCATQPATGSIADITAAFNADKGGGSYCVINIPSGTFSEASSLILTYAGKANVILRGAGPNATTLKFTNTTTTCFGIGQTATCFYNGSATAVGYSPDTCTITAGTTQGSTSVTFGSWPGATIVPSYTTCSLSDLHVGSLFQITQQDDGTTDTGNIWMHGNGPVPPNAWETWGGSSNGWVPNFTTSGNPGRALTQNVTVTGISGSNVTFTPALYSPTWSQSKVPYASYANVLPLSNFGIENLTIDTSLLGDNEAMLNFIWSTQSWTKNIRFVAANTAGGAGTSRKHVLINSSNHVTIRDSYFFGSAGASDGYGVDLSWGTSDSLVENNIFHHISTATITENGSGNVFGYNYAADNYFVSAWNSGVPNSPNWQQCDAFHHDTGDHFNLWEGHEGICAADDDFHGPSFGITHFRSYFSGFDPATLCPSGVNCGTAHKLQFVTAYADMGYNRYENFILNVIGSPNITAYQNVGPSANVSGVLSNCPSVPWFINYSLNYSDQNQLAWSTQGGIGGNPCFPSSFNLDNDPLTASTLVRWANYDNVHASVQTNSAETASSAPVYPGLSSPSTTYSSYKSLYYSGTPSWWDTTKAPWPPIGPDVTGGNIANTGGHANHNLAGYCYLTVLGGKTDGSSAALPFDAANCPYTGSSTPTASTPTFSPSSGAPPQTVTISTTTPSATIYYTTNGTTPTTSSTVYTAPISVTVNPTTVQAIATASGFLQSPVGSATYSGGGTAGTPVFSPSGGAQSYGTTITISTTPSVCNPYIYWSRGTTPPTTGDINGTSLTLLAASTFYAKVIGCPTFSDSAVGSGTFTVNPVATPSFSPAPGTYGSAQTVTLSSATSGATICYTTDGSTPTTNGAGTCVHGSVYSGPFSVATTTTVTAIGTISGATDSSLTSGTYTINGAAAAPTFSPVAGAYGPTQSVVLSSTTTGATICYTVDGSTPTANGSGTCTHGTTYSTAVSVATSLTINAIASASGFTDSPVASAAYTINGAASTPTFSPTAGSYGPSQSVTISSSTSGATICYTTNGSTPASSSAGVCAAGSTQYVSAVTVASSLTIKALATKAGFSDSSVGSAAYTINGSVATPTLTPGAGSYGAAQTVTLATSTGSATLCFTTDGSTPTTNGGGTCTHGTTYSTPITVSTTQTVQVVGTKSGFSDSTLASANYIINGTLPTPTFAPAGGSYGAAQTVTISAASGSPVVLVNTMQETANTNDTIGSVVHRNTYTNCATGFSGGVLQPAGQPVGNLYCTSADKTAAVAAGGPNLGVVSSTISGTGTTPLDNGNGAGGTTSPTSVTATYAGATGTACGTHGSSSSGFISGLTFADPGANAQLVYGLTATGSSSILTVSKYNSSADVARYVAQRDCFTPNSLTVAGSHYESDFNYNTTGGTYLGFGKDYDIPNKKFRAAPQGASWINEELCPVAGGSCISTFTIPTGDSLLIESYEHWDAGCSYSSSTACAYYDALGLQLYNAGSPVGSIAYYNVRNASTHAVISFIPINKTAWTHPQYAIQHQWDINSSTAATLTATVPFSTAVAYYTTSGVATICYTTDGTTPTGNGAGTCTHGTTYTTPITVSSTTTVKAIATQSGFLDSAVGSTTYTITGAAATPTFSPVAGTYVGTQSVTISSSTAGSTLCYTTDGSTPAADGAGTCTHGTTYSGAVSVSASLTLQAIASKAGFSDSSVGSAAYTITGTGTVIQCNPCVIKGTVTIQ